MLGSRHSFLSINAWYAGVPVKSDLKLTNTVVVPQIVTRETFGVTK